MKKIITCLLISFISLSCFSQSYYIISGKIIDETTKQPLQAASVFAENTTIGTASNADGVFTLRLPNGGYNLVVTFTGYQTATKRITTADADSKDIVIEVKQKEKEMQDVVIKASFEVKNGWEKYGDFFLDNFIGKTVNGQQCVIKNRDGIKFFYYKRKNLLKIMSEEPVEIVNDALGYNVKYSLDSFLHDYNTQVTTYSGYPLFQEMESSSLDQLIKWNTARKIAYNGSILHFMRSMYQKKLKEEGFEIQFVIKKNDKETALKLKDFYGSVNYSMDDSINIVEITPNQNQVAIIYKDEESSPLYLEANPEASAKFQLSVVNFLPKESLAIEQNGYYYEQNDITITGYWAWEKVGDMLPYDFKEKLTSGAKEVITNNADPVKPVVDRTVPVTEQTTPIDDHFVIVPTPPGIIAGMLTNVTWKIDESRVIEGANMLYYKRGAEENTINFDNDFYKFDADNTGTYFYNGQQYKFNWKFLNTEKTKMEMVLLYPTPLIVNLENITLTSTSFKYTRLQKVNGVNMVAIESRSVK